MYFQELFGLVKMTLGHVHWYIPATACPNRNLLYPGNLRIIQIVPYQHESEFFKQHNNNEWFSYQTGIRVI